MRPRERTLGMGVAPNSGQRGSYNPVVLKLRASRTLQLLCLQIGDIFIPTLQLEVIFSLHKLYHPVFTSWWRQRERSGPPLFLLLCCRQTCTFLWVSFSVNPLQVLRSPSEGTGPGNLCGNVYCSLLYKSERIFFVAVSAVPGLEKKTEIWFHLPDL